MSVYRIAYSFPCHEFMGSRLAILYRQASSLHRMPTMRPNSSQNLYEGTLYSPCIRILSVLQTPFAFVPSNSPSFDESQGIISALQKDSIVEGTGKIKVESIAFKFRGFAQFLVYFRIIVVLPRSVSRNVVTLAANDKIDTYSLMRQELGERIWAEITLNMKNGEKC